MSRLLTVLLLAVSCALAQDAANQRVGRLLLVLPFENRSTAPGLEWIGESFPEVLNQRMAAPSLFIIGRDDRLFAFDRMGVPATAAPSRATIYTVAQAMDVDFVIVGSYNYDGRTFSSTGQVLDMRSLRLSPVATETGSLTDLISVQTALAFNLLADMEIPGGARSKQQFVASMPQVRLDSLENYVRGAISTSPAEKIRRFKEAVRISPDYTYAKMQLARTYFSFRDYEQAAAWFSRITSTSPQYLEAMFFYGICEYQLGDFAKAQDAFQYVASRLPLTEVQNNLGVLLARRGKPAVEYFRRAAQTDPRDADYQFNLAVALSTADPAEANKRAREALSLSPGDSDARALLDSLQRPGLQQASTTQARRVFYPRLKREYNEAIFRQAELEVRNLEETTLAAKGPERHAISHSDRGNELLTNGFIEEAEREFRESVQVDPMLAAPHIGLVRVALKKNDVKTAQEELGRALELEPKSIEALTLQRELALRAPAIQP